MAHNVQAPRGVAAWADAMYPCPRAMRKCGGAKPTTARCPITRMAHCPNPIKAALPNPHQRGTLPQSHHGTLRLSVVECVHRQLCKPLIPGHHAGAVL